MTLLNRLAKHVFYPLNEFREGTTVLRKLRSLESTQYDRPEQLYELRLRKLRALLGHAFHNTAFYGRRLKEAGIAPEDIRCFEDLRRIPPLTKDDIIQYQDDLRAKNLRLSEVHTDSTGGSTGTRTPFWRDNQCLDIKLAAQYRINQWCGWDVGEKVAVVWPAFVDLHGHAGWRYKLRHMFVDRHRIFDASRLSEAATAQLAARLRRFGPTLIRAFPSPLEVLSTYLRQATNYRIRPTAVLTTGEPLLPSQRELFEDVFNCPVFNCYATRECGHIACECDAHQGLHINAECLHVEFERDGRPVDSGEAGSLLITDFENYGMPFIRYEIGDMGVPLAGQCPCGKTLPRMAMEAGRVADFLLSPHDSSLIPGVLCFELMKKAPGVEQLQIVQDARDHLTLRVRLSGQVASNDAATEPIARVIEGLFHGTMRITFEQVDSIAQEKSGKFRVCINRYLEKTGI